MTVRNLKFIWTPFLISPVQILPRIISLASVMLSALIVGFVSTTVGILIVLYVEQTSYLVMNLFLLLILVSNIVNRLMVSVFEKELV